MKIHLIWAQDQNGGIGKEGKLPWNISEDLKNFKKLTLNSTILMGRHTWESLPIKPLPNRKNIVLSSQNMPEVESYSSVKECVEKLDAQGTSTLFVIGGSKVYQKFIHRADELHITFVDINTVGIDTYFPVTLLKIKEEFKKISELELGDDATYSHWIKK